MGVAVAGILLAVPVPASAAPGGPHPVTSWLAPVEAGEATWVRVDWTTGRKICDAEVTVDGDDVKIGYPGSTGTYTSFSRGPDLTPKRTDYTAFRVRAAYDFSEFVPLEATLTFDTCGPHAVSKTKSFWLILPVLAP
jgi:hypothetical protein